MTNSKGLSHRTPGEYRGDIALIAQRIRLFKRLDEFLKQPKQPDVSSTLTPGYEFSMVYDHRLSPTVL